MNSTTLIAIWGAVVSTILGLIKVYELWSDRPHLSTSFTSCSDATEGNWIEITNTGRIPALMTHWEVVWADKRWLPAKIERIEAPDDRFDGGGLTIPAHDRITLTFAEQNWFPMRTEVDGKRVKLYLRLYPAGRRRRLWFKL